LLQRSVRPSRRRAKVALVPTYDRAMAARRIESVNNRWLKETARLKGRRARQRSGRYLIEGLREAERAVAAGVPLEQVMIAPAIAGDSRRVAELLDAATAAGAELYSLAPAAFARLSMREHPDGVALV